jgi:Holliday junction DNA helicase RuvA
MLGSLRGSVASELENRILIEVSGVGYWVHTGSWHPSGEVYCYLHHHLREGAEDLYGFATLDSLGLFERLLSISGIGPKAALALLSIGSPDRLRQAIAEKDLTFITTAPGIGQKAAQKIVVELYGKLDSLDSILPDTIIPALYLDLAEALTGLGYRPADFRPLFEKLPATALTVEVQLKWMLQQLSR